MRRKNRKTASITLIITEGIVTMEHAENDNHEVFKSKLTDLQWEALHKAIESFVRKPHQVKATPEPVQINALAELKEMCS